MKLPRRAFLHLAAGAAALLAMSRIAWAQAYPTRPVHLIVPFGPAGAADITARLIGQWLSERLGQPFIIDNRPGAGSNIVLRELVPGALRIAVLINPRTASASATADVEMAAHAMGLQARRSSTPATVVKSLTRLPDRERPPRSAPCRPIPILSSGGRDS